METVQDIMSKKVKTSTEDESLINIGKIMKKNDVSTVIIVRGTKPKGIITERDMAQKVVASGLDVREENARDIMTSPIVTIKPTTNIFYASDLMGKEKFKKLPIVEKGKLIGIVTQTDVIRYMREQRKKFVLSNLSATHRKKYPG